MEEEIWRDYPGWEGLYQVSSEGRVKSLARVIVDKRGLKKSIPELLLKLTPNKKSGYVMVSLSKNGEEQHLGVHYMVAKVFVHNDNPNIKTEVNHLNECKVDNRASNLEWVSRSQNTLYGTALQRALGTRIKYKTKNAERGVKQIHKDGSIIACYKSISEASRRTGILLTTISNCLNGRCKSAGNYIWEYNNL